MPQSEVTYEEMNDVVTGSQDHSFDIYREPDWPPGVHWFLVLFTPRGQPNETISGVAETKELAVREAYAELERMEHDDES